MVTFTLWTTEDRGKQFDILTFLNQFLEGSGWSNNCQLVIRYIEEKYF